MNRSENFAVLIAILLFSILIFAQNATVQPQATTVEGAVTYAYKSVNGAELRLHVFNPPNHNLSSKKLPAIVFFFGGGWTNGNVGQFVPQSEHLAQRGMIAIVADYRVFGRHQTSPFEAIADAKSAIRWMRLHATELGIDPNRIAAAGGSSGGHIALSAAVFDEFDEVSESSKVSSKPNALVLFNPAVDTTHQSEQLKDRFGIRAREGSPLDHLRRGLPPTVIFHGKADTNVPYADVERFCAESKKLGNQCQLFGYDGAVHGFFNPSVEQGKWFKETLLEADRYLTKIQYLPKPVPMQIP